MIDVIARIVLGLVFIFAGIAKVRTPHWSVMALENGTPRPVVVGLPAFEALLGLALMLQLAPLVLPIVALALLLAFTAVLIYRVRTASATPCNCFGGKSNSPVSNIDIARNVLLIIVAVVAI